MNYRPHAQVYWPIPRWRSLDSPDNCSLDHSCIYDRESTLSLPSAHRGPYVDLTEGVGMDYQSHFHSRHRDRVPPVNPRLNHHTPRQRSSENHEDRRVAHFSLDRDELGGIGKICYLFRHGSQCYLVKLSDYVLSSQQ